VSRYAIFEACRFLACCVGAGALLGGAVEGLRVLLDH
jgi:hypothetical protein